MQKNNLLVLGLGTSGINALEILTNFREKYKNYEIFAADIDVKKIEDCRKKYPKNIRFINQKDVLNFNFNWTIVSPGIKILKSKIKEIKYLSKTCSKFSSDISLISEINCDKISIGVTGTNGKTTTSLLLKTIIDDSFITGNIGISKDYGNLNLTDSVKFSNIIYELSSYQLQKEKDISLTAAIFLNINSHGAHEKTHGGLKKYMLDKMNIFNNAKYCIINDNLKKYSKKYYENRDFIYFSTAKKIKNGYSFLNGKLYKDAEFLRSLDIKYLKYTNNDNICAILATLFTIFNGDKLSKTLKNLEKIESLPLLHRCKEIILNKDTNIVFVNNSKATNAASLNFTLNKYKNKNHENFIILCGACETESSIKHIYNEIRNEKNIYIFGELAEKFKNSEYSKFLKVKFFSHMEDAVNSAFEDSKNFLNNKKKYIILAPGLQSFDQFENFEQRGKEFEKIIENLQKS